MMTLLCYLSFTRILLQVWAGENGNEAKRIIWGEYA